MTEFQVTDEMVERAIAARPGTDTIQGFYYDSSDLHVIRDVSKPFPEQELWRMISTDYDFAHAEMMREIERIKVRAALSAALSGAEPEDAALVGIRETVEEVGGWWKACSGCYDTEDGHPTRAYDYSRSLDTPVGCGCRECGGLGAVWEYYSDAELAAMQEEFLAPPALQKEGK